MKSVDTLPDRERIRCPTCDTQPDRETYKDEPVLRCPDCKAILYRSFEATS